MQPRILISFLISGLMLSCSTPQDQSENTSTETYKMDRTILPIHPPTAKVVTEMDARNVEKPDIFEIKAPEGSPNIVIVMIDDIGFGATSTFGGAIETPTFDRLADEHIRKITLFKKEKN